MQTITDCESCRGRGEAIPEHEICTKCSGSKIYGEEVVLKVDISKGMKYGQDIIMRGEGNHFPDTVSGHLIFNIQRPPEDECPFKLINNGVDLLLEKELSVADALCGYKFSFHHLDDRSVFVDLSNEVISPDSTFKVVGSGMPYPSSTASIEYGDLLIKFKIVFPNQLSQKQKKAIADNFSLSTQKGSKSGDHKVQVSKIDSNSYPGKKRKRSQSNHRGPRYEYAPDPQAENVQCTTQ